MECWFFHGVVRHLHWHCYFTYKAQLLKTLQTPTKPRRISTNKKIYMLYIYISIYIYLFLISFFFAALGTTTYDRLTLRKLYFWYRVVQLPREKKLVVTKTVIAVASTCSVHLPRLFPGLNGPPKIFQVPRICWCNPGRGVVLAFVKFGLAVLAGTTLFSSLDKVSFCTALTSSLLARSLPGCLAPN